MHKPKRKESNLMSLQVKDWVVYNEEKQEIGKWVDMPENVIGKPLYEHWSYYITILTNGERIMVRKRDNFIFENGNSTNSDKSNLAIKLELEYVLFTVRKKALFKRLFQINGKGAS